MVRARSSAGPGEARKEDRLRGRDHGSQSQAEAPMCSISTQRSSGRLGEQGLGPECVFLGTCVQSGWARCVPGGPRADSATVLAAPGPTRQALHLRPQGPVLPQPPICI